MAEKVRFEVQLTAKAAQKLADLAEFYGETRAAVLRRLIMAAKLPKGTA